MPTAAELLTEMRPAWRDALAGRVSPEYLEAFIGRHKRRLESALEPIALALAAVPPVDVYELAEDVARRLRGRSEIANALANTSDDFSSGRFVIELDRQLPRVMVEFLPTVAGGQTKGADTPKNLAIYRRWSDDEDFRRRLRELVRELLWERRPGWNSSLTSDDAKLEEAKADREKEARTRLRSTQLRNAATKLAERRVKVSADSIALLRRPDVERVLNETPPGERRQVAYILGERRPELVDEIDAVMTEVLSEPANWSTYGRDEIYQPGSRAKREALAESEAPSNRQHRAIQAWQRVRDAMPVDEMAYIRAHGRGGEYDAPPVTARAIEDDDADAPPDSWLFWTVEPQESDSPGYSRWLRRARVAGHTDPKPGRVYLPLDATIEDAWRRFEPRRYDRLVRFDESASQPSDPDFAAVLQLVRGRRGYFEGSGHGPGVMTDHEAALRLWNAGFRSHMDLVDDGRPLLRAAGHDVSTPREREAWDYKAVPAHETASAAPWRSSEATVASEFEVDGTKCTIFIRPPGYHVRVMDGGLEIWLDTLDGSDLRAQAESRLESMLNPRPAVALIDQKLHDSIQDRNKQAAERVVHAFILAAQRISENRPSNKAPAGAAELERALDAAEPSIDEAERELAALAAEDGKPRPVVMASLEAGGIILLRPHGFLSGDLFKTYRDATSRLQYVSYPRKGQRGVPSVVARAVLALERDGFEVRAENPEVIGSLIETGGLDHALASGPPPPRDAAARPSNRTNDPSLIARVQAMAADPPTSTIKYLLKELRLNGELPLQVIDWKNGGKRTLESALEEGEGKVARKLARRPKAERLRADGEERPAKDANEEHAAQALVQLANMDPDRAHEINEAGFSKVDVTTGHALARRWEASGELTGDEWAWAVEVANKYRRQVGPLPEPKSKAKRQRSKESSLSAEDRLFVGVMPTGIVYADRSHEVDGDYARCAFLPFDTLFLAIAPKCPKDMVGLIEADAATIIAKRGEQFPISSSNQTVLLGSKYVPATSTVTLTNTPSGRVHLSSAASRMLAKMTDGAGSLTLSHKDTEGLAAALELRDAGLAELTGEPRVVLPTLTVDNHERANTILNVGHPEWGIKRFNRDPSERGHHSYGSGSNSALLFASEFSNWVVASWLPTAAEVAAEHAEREAYLDENRPGWREARKPVSEPTKLEGTRAMAQRMVNAEDGFIEAIQERGFTREEAAKAMATMLRTKVAVLDPVSGTIRVKHGAFLEPDVIRNAVDAWVEPTAKMGQGERARSTSGMSYAGNSLATIQDVVSSLKRNLGKIYESYKLEIGVLRTIGDNSVMLSFYRVPPDASDLDAANAKSKVRIVIRGEGRTNGPTWPTDQTPERLTVSTVWEHNAPKLRKRSGPPSVIVATVASWFVVNSATLMSGDGPVRFHYVECPKCESSFKVPKSVTAVPAHKCWAKEKEDARREAGSRGGQNFDLGGSHITTTLHDMFPGERDEEARMGAALRGARDVEEAQWELDVERGTRAEIQAHGLGLEEARKAAVANLGRDAHYYEKMNEEKWGFRP